MYAMDAFKLRVATAADAALLRRLLSLDGRPPTHAGPAYEGAASVREHLFAALTA
jgi:hypothetical protein